MAVMHDLDWLFALGTIFFMISAWAIGANDVANSYATSVASGSLTLLQAGVLQMITETVGSIALGTRVTGTIRSGVFSVKPFANSPGVLILAMVCAEFGAGTWVAIATKFGFPVSTTHSIIGALVGIGIAADLKVTWGWKKYSVSQIAASWVISPLIAGAFGAIIFLSIKYSVLKRADPLKWGLRLIPFYFGMTGGILALFIIISGSNGIPSLDKMGAGVATGSVLGSFFLCLVIAYVFFLPYFWRRLIKEDRRIHILHVFMGPMLWRENCHIPFPRKHTEELVPDYYKGTYAGDVDPSDEQVKVVAARNSSVSGSPVSHAIPVSEKVDGISPEREAVASIRKVDAVGLQQVDKLPIWHPKRIFATLKYVLLRGVTQDVVTHQSKGLAHVHARAPRYDNKVEHLWTAAQVASAMLMSLAHGSNDVSNAIGPWATEYLTWRSGKSSATVETPVWIRAVGGLLLSVGFWTYGYHLMRNLGNKITQHSPTRGYSMEMGTAITVLMASRLGLPVSTTQCITGATLGVALMNFDLKTINGRQVLKIFSGWIVTLPIAGLLAGITIGMALNVPQWGPRPAS
jgi:PiT family inorganic phosphate transporter/sodium-dependent phosphate transporter